jgi:hypothetical protein
MPCYAVFAVASSGVVVRRTNHRSKHFRGLLGIPVVVKLARYTLDRSDSVVDNFDWMVDSMSSEVEEGDSFVDSLPVEDCRRYCRNLSDRMVVQRIETLKPREEFRKFVEL